jgi:hypothetical protein
LIWTKASSGTDIADISTSTSSMGSRSSGAARTSTRAQGRSSGAVTRTSRAPSGRHSVLGLISSRRSSSPGTSRR